jgi:hypothetical protein
VVENEGDAMSASTIITHHMVKRTAEHELGRLWTVQQRALAGDLGAKAELGRRGIGTESKLAIHHERRMFFKWAVVSTP